MDIVTALAESGTTRNDLLRLLCGEQLGRGVSRRVYTLALAPKFVVKLETEAKSFCNQVEWETWQAVKLTKWAPWFAPCEDISACGAVLVQHRARPLAKLPPEIPSFFWDVKVENFGRIGGRTVCLDYGSSGLFCNLKGAKMRAVSEYERGRL